MKRMTSEIIASLQKFVNEHGDMPFELRDNENGCSHFDITIFADIKDNGANCGREISTIGMLF